MTIDSHQHFWKYDPVEYPWIDEGTMSVLQRDFLPGDLKVLLAKYQVDFCLAVQARQSLDETQFLLGLAEENDFVRGVIGWIDLKTADLNKQVERLESPHLIGFRHVLQDEPDGFSLDPAFLRGVETILDNGYTYDILIYAHQLPEILEFVKHFSERPMVVDHIAKPNIRDGRILKWKQHMLELARHPNIHCKLSGMVTEAHWMYWSTDDFMPYIDHVLECFGPDRCMFGSDWPVCTLAASYGQVKELLDECIRTLADEEKEAILGLTAARFYGINNNP